jgi:tryptophanyl-tRNA synthetase
MSEIRRVLTGITTSGTPHLGNYVGAIRPAIAASNAPGVTSFYFLADYHALIKCDDPARIQSSTLEIAASWLACGLDPEKVYFYRQSDIPQIPELTWLLTCVAAKGLMNRAHAYKAAVDQNLAVDEDADSGITMGLFSYPILMAADILLFNAHQVPVGRDQVQHIEMARDIGQRFNRIYGAEYFTLPEAAIEESVATLPGLDGRKMSKSYNNTIPLWLGEKELKKALLGIVTNSLAPGEPKDPDDSNIFTIYQAFATPAESAEMRSAFRDGISWGEAKQKLFERVNGELAPARERYRALIARPVEIENILQVGAEKANTIAIPLLRRLREAVGLRSLSATSPGQTVTVVVKPGGQARKPKYVGPYRTGGSYMFRLETGKDEELFVSTGYSSYAAAEAARKILQDASPAEMALTPSPSIASALREITLSGKVAGALVLNGRSDAEALEKFLEAKEGANS